MELSTQFVMMVLLLCVSRQRCTLLSVSPDPKTSSNSSSVSLKFINRSDIQNATNLSSTNPQDVKIFSMLQSFNNMEKYLFKHLYTLEGSDENIFSTTNGPLGIFSDKVSNKTGALNSLPCTNDTTRLIMGFLNGDNWAIQFFDATGKPGPSLTLGQLNFVGNYDQCRSATAPPGSSPNGDGESDQGFHGGYFQVAFGTPSVPIPIQIGLCLPDTCSEEEIASIGRELIEAANLSLSVMFVHHLTNATEMTTAAILAIVASCAIGLMIILGTLYDLLFVQLPFWCKGDEHSAVVYTHGNGHPTNISNDNNNRDKKETLQMDTTLKQKAICSRSVTLNIMLAFSVYSNAKKTLNVSQAPGSLQSIHGIRFLSISWVVLAHTFFFARLYGTNIVTAFPKFLNRWTFDAIVNALVSVDTFFTLSGLLTSYLTIGQLMKKGPRLNWPLFYFHRFWRLTPPYMLSILLYLGFQQYFIRGPLGNFEQPTDKSACENNWWTNLLYINNLVKVDNMCFGHSWYLSNDMQFFIISPLMMIPFYYSRLAGISSCLVFLLASCITTGVSSTLEGWPTATLGLKSLDNQVKGGMGDLDFFHHYYLTPWCRIGPFIVGILAGYVLAVHKGRPFYIKGWIVVLGWIAAASSALAVLYGLRGDITGNHPSSLGASAFYNTMARSVWGACVSWVIIACTAGYGGPVNALLSWSPFVVLGRLSYMVYLLHIPVILIFYQNLDQLFYMNDTTMAVYFLGLLVASNIVAFVFMLALESPMIGLEKAILKRGA